MFGISCMWRTLKKHGPIGFGIRAHKGTGGLWHAHAQVSSAAITAVHSHLTSQKVSSASRKRTR